MPSAYGKDFDDLLRRVRREIACEPFRVRTLPAAAMSDCDGDYSAGLIRIARGLSGVRARETLLHELAHHLDGWTENVRNAHRASWGRHYARLETFRIAPEADE